MNTTRLSRRTLFGGALAAAIAKLVPWKTPVNPIWRGDPPGTAVGSVQLYGGGRTAGMRSSVLLAEEEAFGPSPTYHLVLRIPLTSDNSPREGVWR